MKIRILTSLNLLVWLCVIGVAFSCNNKKQNVDFLITNVSIIDGVESEPFIGVIGISADTIAFVGTSSRNIEAKHSFDGTNLIACPGFIDPHTHALGDLQGNVNNQNINYLTQGVTTVVVGNDGSGPFDLKKASDSFSQKGIGTNAAFLVGHGVVREAVMGLENREPSQKELTEMKSLVIKAMDAGAFGFSTGLYYAPGSFASTEEVIELTKEVKPYGGIYDSHIRDESSYTIGLMAAVEETLEIGRQTGVPIHFAHIKALGVDVWGNSMDIINKINEARESGLRVTADQYPWSASGTHLENAVINRWVMAGSEDQYYERLSNNKLLPKISDEIKENIRKRGGPESILITGDYSEPEFIGKNLKELSDSLNIDPVILSLRIARNKGARIASFNMNEEDIKAFMKQEWVVTSSDGTKGHPRKYASFPRKYEKYVKQEKVLSLNEFVSKSSTLTAEIFGFERRGKLEVGYFADIVLINLDKYSQLADFQSPEKISSGVEFVFVNGKIAINEGLYTGVLNGRMLRKNQEALILNTP